jgi:hypothetical protein
MQKWEDKAEKILVETLKKAFIQKELWMAPKLFATISRERKKGK